jgi:ABC-type phosphate transport system permease subunit
MSEKENPFKNLRPMLLSVIIGILQVFLFAEGLIIAVMVYSWNKDPISFTQNQNDKGLIVLVIVLILTYLVKRNINKLMK